MAGTIVFFVLLAHAISDLQVVFISISTRDFGNWNYQLWLLGNDYAHPISE
jgi:hypothetical protein